jgi:hypothetical protein
MQCYAEQFESVCTTREFKGCWQAVPGQWCRNGESSLFELQTGSRNNIVTASVGTKSGLRQNVGIRGQKVRQVQWCMTDGNLVNQHAQLVVDPLCDRQPMQVSLSGSDMITRPQLKHESSSSVNDSLELGLRGRWQPCEF